MSDEEIVKMLFARSEAGIEALDKKYGAKCRSIAKSIVGNEQDAEECVNDTYLAIWNTIPPTRPDPLSSFLYRILRHQSLKKYDSNTTKKRSCVLEELLDELEEFLPSAESVESSIEQKELARAIEDFLETLTPDNRKVFMRRYWYSESYETIARDMGMSKNNISMRLVRTRTKMRKFLKERGIEV